MSTKFPCQGYFFFYKILAILLCELISKLAGLGKASHHSKHWTLGFLSENVNVGSVRWDRPSLCMASCLQSCACSLNYCNAVADKWTHVVNNNVVFCSLYIRNQKHHKSEIFWTDVAVHHYTWHKGLGLEMKLSVESCSNIRKNLSSRK